MDHFNIEKMSKNWHIYKQYSLHYMIEITTTIIRRCWYMLFNMICRIFLHNVQDSLCGVVYYKMLIWHAENQYVWSYPTSLAICIGIQLKNRTFKIKCQNIEGLKSLLCRLSTGIWIPANIWLYSLGINRAVMNSTFTQGSLPTTLQILTRTSWIWRFR